MSVSNKKISAPVSVSEVSSVLRFTSKSIAMLCSSGRINKWSKRKPIRFDKVTPLTADDRKGSAEDRAAGYYYGVLTKLPSNIIKNLHSMTFDYRAVRRGQDWSRLGDFDGYDHLAVANPLGEIPPSAVIDREDGIAATCKIIYDTANTTGIDVSDVIGAATSSEMTLGDMYPCVLLTFGGKNYVRALWNINYAIDGVGTQLSGFTKMKQGDVWQGGWYMLGDGLSAATAGTETTATIFFVDKIVDSFEGRDWRQWTEISDTLATENLYPCPEAVAQSLTFTVAFTKGMGVSAVNWVALPNGQTINLTLNIEWIDPDPEATYTLNGTIWTTEGTATRLGTFSSQPDRGLTMVFATVATSAVGLTGNEKLRLEWTVTSSKRPGQPVNSGSTNMY